MDDNDLAVDLSVQIYCFSSVNLSNKLTSKSKAKSLHSKIK